ncbi:MAG: DUF11 domain-containing protein [Gemmataceae bacterium]|nr:DUF11 domain-containing protein [Gemmataceae bacterium]
MGGRTIRRAALVLAALAWAAAAPAQPPDDEPEPPGMLDPLVLPADAQLLQPAGPANREPPPTARPVADPPAPVVRIQVRVPADTPPNDPIKYLLTVRNESRADAHAVTVRNPLPEDAAEVVRADPPPDKGADPAKPLVWSLGTLKAGESKTIELVLRPKPNAKEVRNLAYVRFEHGEAVTTKIAAPGLKVTKAAPKEAVRDEPFAVRVVVENTGKVPAEGVRVVETVPGGAEVEPVTAGGRRTKAGENQWEWDVGTLMPGRRQVIEYRLTPKPSPTGEVVTTTHVPAAKNVQEKAEARTRVLVPGLSLKLAGPAGPIGPGEPAEYEVTVRNTGTLPAANVRVSGTIPADCRLTKKTEGGQATRDAVVWVVPRLEPEEARSFRFALRAGTTGRRAVGASATDARRQKDAKEVSTLFQGTAALVWEQVLEPAAVAAGRQGTLTVKVRNNGGEAARNVRVEVDLPDGVSFVQSTPALRPDRAAAFPPESVPAGGEKVYTITYRADRGGEAFFRMRLSADALGDRPMTAEKSVSITGGG